MYKSRRRPWVKLYCREWLTSTVRFDLTESDRSRFIDLLALAGDSKVPGVVCAGFEGSKLAGYPIDWLSSTMRCAVADLRKSLEKFRKSGRISVSGPEGFPVIRISGWKKYQSEYLRQIESVRRRANLQNSPQLAGLTSETSTQLPHTEGEGEGEREVEAETEGEIEGEREKDAQATPSRFAFHNTLLQVTKKQDAILGEAFPWVDRQQEYRYITSWLEANPDRRPKNSGRFLQNWFAKIEKPDQEKPNAATERTRRNLKTLGFTLR